MSADEATLQGVADRRKRPRAQLSLKGRALRLLARREHSRAELRRKLLVEDVSEDALDAVLDDLEAKCLLSDRRYAESVAHSKGARQGFASVARSLSQQGVSPQVAAEALAPLRANERERAMAVWKRRFGEQPADLRERARQHRFLLGRGFAPSTVSWVLKQSSE